MSEVKKAPEFTRFQIIWFRMFAGMFGCAVFAAYIALRFPATRPLSSYTAIGIAAYVAAFLIPGIQRLAIWPFLFILAPWSSQAVRFRFPYLLQPIDNFPTDVIEKHAEILSNRKSLDTLGFRSHGVFHIRGPTCFAGTDEPTDGYWEMFIHGSRPELAIILHERWESHTLNTSVQFLTRFPNGKRMVTHNSILEVDPTETYAGFAYPKLKDIAALAQRHRELVHRCAGHLQPAPPAPLGCEAALRLEIDRMTQDAKDAGWYETTPDPNILRMKRSRAIVASWAAIFPFAQITRWRRWRKLNAWQA